MNVRIDYTTILLSDSLRNSSRTDRCRCLSSWISCCYAMSTNRQRFRCSLRFLIGIRRLLLPLWNFDIRQMFLLHSNLPYRCGVCNWFQIVLSCDEYCRDLRNCQRLSSVLIRAVLKDCYILYSIMQNSESSWFEGTRTEYGRIVLQTLGGSDRDQGALRGRLGAIGVYIYINNPIFGKKLNTACHSLILGREIKLLIVLLTKPEIWTQQSKSSLITCHVTIKIHSGFRSSLDHSPTTGILNKIKKKSIC